MSQSKTVHDEFCGKKIWGPARPCNCEQRNAVRANRRPVSLHPRPHACCPEAVPIKCVCAYAYDCEFHGQTHIGSHD